MIFFSYLISSHWTMMECWWFPWKFLWKNVECTLNCLSWNITKKDSHYLVYSISNLGGKIYKKNIYLFKKIYINQKITQSLDSLMSQLFHDWFINSFTSLSIKLDFILKSDSTCSQKNTSIHHFIQTSNIKTFFSVLSRKWSTVTKRLSAFAFRCSSESHVTSST